MTSSSPRVLLIDNYDSFTYNLAQLVETLGYECRVVRNDETSIEEIRRGKPRAILLSPGPGTPDSAGITLEVIRELGPEFPIFGVCLGLQSIGQAFGGRVVRAPRPKHGKVSEITHSGRGIFRGVAEPMRVARYHSLIVERESLPDCLAVTAETEGLIMALEHREHRIAAVQFHPESIATVGGDRILDNFLKENGAT